jgi:membrane-bound inhibitor of C-type lysozyme
VVTETITLILYMGGSVAEHTAFEQISKCLKTKRTIERNLYKKSTAVRYACENKTVVIEKNEDGSSYIVKIVD